MQPHTSYLVCGTPRSGSSLLCEALKNTGIAGNPEEYFWQGDEPFWSRRWRVSNYADYMTKAIEQGTTQNGVFGAKIMWGYFDDFVGKLKQIPVYQNVDLPALLPRVFPNLHYVWITRRDKVRQAISFWKAIETNVWSWSSDESPVPAKEPAFNYEAIQSLEQEIMAHEAAWRQYFELCRVEPLVVVYEELVPAVEETARQVLQFLGINVPPGLVFAERKLKRQADAITEAWIKAYYEQNG